MIINTFILTCEVFNMIAPTLYNPFLDLHFNQLNTTQNVRNNTFEQNKLPSDTEDKEEVDVCIIEVQVPLIQGVIAPISDLDEGEDNNS